MSVDTAEKKWDKAKAAVKKEDYDTEDAYWAVVTTVFKKMMGEEQSILSFREFRNLDEIADD